jgi:formylglycine-generating enzyme required for sulfatase activity
MHLDYSNYSILGLMKIAAKRKRGFTALVMLSLLVLVILIQAFLCLQWSRSSYANLDDRKGTDAPSATPTAERLETQKLERGSRLPQLASFEFEVVTLNASSALVDKRKGRVRFYQEDLGDAVGLDMVEIPPGSFLMGTSYAEAEGVTEEYKRHLNQSTKRYGDQYVPQEIPRHRVQLEGFFIGRFEVTQEQWRAVAKLPKLNRDLVNDPSYFKGDQLPVDSVSWEDALEFCNRLSQSTRRRYRLPSEAEWEYACRAGTTTQFSSGSTITAAVANYRSEYPYAGAPEDISRNHTTPVGSLGVANAFGLCDMHGNVEEWCLDPWHENYNIAPQDGSVWGFRGDPNTRVTRGGSWTAMAASCRSAFRIGVWSTRADFRLGFRLVCSFGQPPKK